MLDIGSFSVGFAIGGSTVATVLSVIVTINLRKINRKLARWQLP